jgi:hypothetical protein
MPYRNQDALIYGIGMVPLKLWWLKLHNYNRGIFLVIFTHIIQHCFICSPSDFTVSEMLGSNPGLFRLWHWQSDALTTRLDLIHSELDLIYFFSFFLFFLFSHGAATNIEGLGG